MLVVTEILSSPERSCADHGWTAHIFQLPLQARIGQQAHPLALDAAEEAAAQSTCLWPAHYMVTYLISYKAYGMGFAAQAAGLSVIAFLLVVSAVV